MSPVEPSTGDSHALDLPALLAELRAQPGPARDGRRQVTVFQRRPVALVLFSFDAGGTLRRHSANGLVTIHVLEGRLVVEAEAREHDLQAGGLLVLHPNVPHSVCAVDASAMLLTVHKEDGR